MIRSSAGSFPKGEVSILVAELALRAIIGTKWRSRDLRVPQRPRLDDEPARAAIYSPSTHEEGATMTRRAQSFPLGFHLFSLSLEAWISSGLALGFLMTRIIPSCKIEETCTPSADSSLL